MPFPFSAVPARVRSSGGRLVRRLGLLPGGEPDGLGEDATLTGAALDGRVVAFFPEPPRNAYQLGQWLPQLEVLSQRHGVTVVTQDSRTTAWLRRRTALPVLCVGRTATLDGLLQRSDVALAVYVSHHPRNFQMLRHPSAAHVYLGHGESDKAVSASNQLKAYDRAFVAGPAAEQRILDELMWFDRGRLVRIGRPQAAASSPRPVPAVPTVLYAPTWEGAQPSMAYSSVATHGRALIASLLAGGLRVVYRPHPRTGANRRDVAAADAGLRRLLGTAEAVGTGSTVDLDRPLQDAFADADLLLTDVSSLAVEWLPTGRPLVVTVPADPAAVVTPSPLLDAVPRLAAADAERAAELVRRQLADDAQRSARAALVDHYLGGGDPDAALARFLDACDDVIAARDAVRVAP
ncbi:glycosyl transferase [Blastococcus sp. TF02-09]|uniref:CDP-glycerol glycerophosphotransferase family protein n=1 Tax=Blastococcus sp. TF02-09 TaxID=2250576 RepID=UPI000DEA0E4D|nr:CDP-glycerol glycerophosphotransferase family protein [Blastococcus sp. TF02-9]RBY80128.1 glycosyl transferase [Blastococcus sp. TF02-9]